MKRICIVGLLLLSTASYGASVYKWTDKNGRVHYGDKPVHNAEKIGPKVGTAATEPSPDTVEREKRAAECKSQKDQLAVYQSAARLVEQDSLGKQREFTAEEKQKLIALTEQKVKAICAPLPPPPPKPEGEAETAPADAAPPSGTPPPAQ